jgi:small multidrug resistance pump
LGIIQVSSQRNAHEGLRHLIFAILSEVIATSALKFSEGFTRLIPVLCCDRIWIVVLFIITSHEVFPIGVAYAISRRGLVLTVIAG